MVVPVPEQHWVITFGPFCVNRAKRVVERDGVPVRIGGRAFDILAHLLERQGEVVSHRALLDVAWPTINVEQGNLRFQITMLRQALGDKTYIINVPGRGYCFAAPLSGYYDTDAPQAQSRTRLGSSLFPTRLIGREQAIEDLCALIRSHRLVTIVATGGMGKSSVAAKVAGEVGGLFKDSVCFIDLSRIESDKAVAEVVGVALGLSMWSSDAIVEMLRTRRMLMIFDGCEHVIGEVALLLERILAAAPSISVLATSREALRCEHERVYALEPLATPLHPTNPSQIMSYPAPLLFIENVQAPLSMTLQQAGYIADICTRLDGVPLAIEFASSQVQVFGLQELASLVDDNISLDWPGRRTAPPRHRSLRALLDWSYRLLTERETKVFRSLAIFPQWFSQSDAREIANAEDLTNATIAVTIGELVSKTLITTKQVGGDTRYRLLGATRTFARAKLFEAGEYDEVCERHARHVLQAMQAAGPMDELPGRMEDARAALRWASSPGGNAALQDALTRVITRRTE